MRLSNSFYDILKQAKSGSSSALSPTDLKYAVSKICPQFSGYG